MQPNECQAEKAFKGKKGTGTGLSTEYTLRKNEQLKLTRPRGYLQDVIGT